MAKIKSLSFLVFILIFAGCTILFQQWRSQLHDLPAVRDTQPDAFAANILSKQFDDSGKKVREFDSSFISYFDEPSRATAQNPFLSTLLNNGHVLKIKAQQARLLDKDMMHLQGGVHVHLQYDQQTPITLRSSALSYSLKSGRASTDRLVTLHNPHYFTLQAKGATADFKNGLYTLNNQVRGTYVPKTR